MKIVPLDPDIRWEYEPPAANNPDAEKCIQYTTNKRNEVITWGVEHTIFY